MPPQGPQLLRQLIRSRQCKRNRSPRSFDPSKLFVHLRLLLHLRLFLLLLLLLLLLNRQQQQLEQQQAPIGKPPHWLSSQLLTRSQPHSVKALLSHTRKTAPFECAAEVRFVTGRAITPLFITPLITTPPTPSCVWVCGSAITPRGLSHFVAPASCTLTPGLHKIPHPPQDTASSGIVFKTENVITGLWFLVYEERKEHNSCRRSQAHFGIARNTNAT